MQIQIHSADYVGSCQFCNKTQTVKYKVICVTGRTHIRMCFDCFRKIYDTCLEEIRGESNKSN